MLEDPMIISSVMTDERRYNPIEVGGNLRLDFHQQLGIKYCQLIQNPYLPASKQFILDEIRKEDNILSTTLVIDKRALDDDDLLQTIREKVEKNNHKISIRIADEGYLLTKKDYDRLSFAEDIFVDYCTEELVNAPKIDLQLGIFKMDIQAAQPVIERRNNFNDLEGRFTFHITHPLLEEEFEILKDRIERNDNAAIELDYFDPSYYQEFLEGLQRHHIKENINIQLIGYLLEDQLDTYKALQTYPYEIDVVYSTCHDMVDAYTKEPYTENRLYYSQIEGGGKTSLNNYINVLTEVHNFETRVQQWNLSPLEAAVLAKMQIDEEYIYDPDPDNTDEWNNINLSQIINHEVNGQKRAVCMGFSTLFSAYLRRVGIPMFRYSTTRHSRNIGRIKDDKYGIDTICTCDLTDDLLSNNNDLPTYIAFMLAPRESIKFKRNDHYEEMTIGDTFALPIKDYLDTYPHTNLVYEQFYSPIGYNPLGYTARMLELMGIAPEEGLSIDIYDIIYRLCEEGYLESVPKDAISRAINRVLDLKGSNRHPRDFYNQCVEDSFACRPLRFQDPPAIGGGTPGVEYPVHLLTQENVASYRAKLPEERPIYFKAIPEESIQQEESHEIVQEPEIEIPTRETVEEIVDEGSNSDLEDMFEYSEDYIPGTNIHRPRERGIYETDEEYVEFLRDFYARHFPRESYIDSLLHYVEENNLTIYDYYVQIANDYRNQEEQKIPPFERNNPFITENDHNLLLNEEDNRIPLFFAGTLSKIIERNISDNRLQELFLNPVEKYNEEVGKIHV